MLDGVRYCIERIEIDPPLAVVTCASPDGSKVTGHALIPLTRDEFVILDPRALVYRAGVLTAGITFAFGADL